ncbi:ribbon-helix-helix protein, CopG family [Microbacterium rhizomatis]|uniref:Ribbon-helix-helix protein, CopG family n=1 Tax=Microbacterium rhizomatis TaxID=1631477 RepID=A0A5J5J9A5_9MICO|nr:ribbon-helix-helix protein, CopG family [Microbacterium rhizomatis]KAA9111378.1 ribbon-helix-helix protein, CopG family [Microbacterium rhizomatis]
MRTTVILPDELYRQVKERARAEDRTVTSFLEDALRRELARRELPARPRYVVKSTGSGGVMPGVDLTNNAALLDLLEEDLPIDKRR